MYRYKWIPENTYDIISPNGKTIATCWTEYAAKLIVAALNRYSKGIRQGRIGVP